MKKRLRKKKRVGEFQELGFTVSFELDPNMTTAERNAWHGWNNEEEDEEIL